MFNNKKLSGAQRRKINRQKQTEINSSQKPIEKYLKTPKLLPDCESRTDNVMPCEDDVYLRSVNNNNKIINSTNEKSDNVFNQDDYNDNGLIETNKTDEDDKNYENHDDDDDYQKNNLIPQVQKKKINNHKVSIIISDDEHSKIGDTEEDCENVDNEDDENDENSENGENGDKIDDDQTNNIIPLLEDKKRKVATILSSDDDEYRQNDDNDEYDANKENYGGYNKNDDNLDRDNQMNNVIPLLKNKKNNNKRKVSKIISSSDDDECDEQNDDSDEYYPNLDDDDDANDEYNEDDEGDDINDDNHDDDDHTNNLIPLPMKNKFNKRKVITIFSSDEDDDDDIGNVDNDGDNYLVAGTNANNLSSALTNNNTESEETINSSNIFKKQDIGFLRFGASGSAVVSQHLRKEIIKKGSIFFQNKNAIFPQVNGRSMNSLWFYRKLSNGSTVDRSWLIFSPFRKAAYCFCCLLFPNTSLQQHSSFELKKGFSKWRNLEKVVLHENGPNHRKSFLNWKEGERRIFLGQTIDKEAERQIISEKNRWCEVLTRILSAIRLLASQNLSFRGHRESLNDNNNPGNFIAVLKFLSEYDPVMAQHLENAIQNPGSTSYLSPEIQNELIEVLGTKMRNNFLSMIQKNKYFGIMLDSTPDLAHREQMSNIVRFVDINYDTKEVVIKECFLGFIQIHEKDAKSLETAILEQLREDKLSLEDCRSQCYDNASVMSGRIGGLQQKILEKNPKALFLNCDNHSLNLVCVHAAKQDALMITFFGTVDRVYVFFSRSTYRWDALKKDIGVAFKSECDTRWSSKYAAVKAIIQNIDKLVDLLEAMVADNTQSEDTNVDAQILLQNILNYNFLVLLKFWEAVLAKIDRVQQRLQDPKMNFKDAALDINALKIWFHENRDDLCLESLKFGCDKCKEWEISVERRVRRKRKMPGEVARDEGLSAEQEITRVVKEALDRLHMEMLNRFSRLNDLDEKFGFLLDTDTLLNFVDKKELKKKCFDFGQFYLNDVNWEELYTEIEDCSILLKTRNELVKTPKELLTFIISFGEDVFPNLTIALQILLTISVSIASCERSFSKLKLILNYLRSSMSQFRLNSLAMMSIEREMLYTTNFNEVIHEFATSKSRKVNLF